MSRRSYIPIAFICAALVTAAVIFFTGRARGQDEDAPQTAAPAAALSPADAVGSAFTYQGQLTDGGEPAEGAYDFRFRLYDAAAEGAQVGTTVTLDGVTVEGGLFTVSLDFGAVFDGAALWLQIDVRPGGGDAYTALTPRRPLAPAPYALSLRPGALVSGAVDDQHGALEVANSGNGDGLRVHSAGDDGLVVEEAGGDGVNVFSSGDDGVSVAEAGRDGVRVFLAGQHGLLVGAAISTGVRLGATGDHGFYVSDAGGDGLHVEQAGAEGVYVGEAGRDGVIVRVAGGNGVHVSEAGDDGLRVYSAGDDGLVVVEAGDDGVYVGEAGGNGVSARTVNTNTYGGRFINSAWSTDGQGAGLFAVGNQGYAPDIVLGATYEGGNAADDGRIYSDPDSSSSDIGLHTMDKAWVVLDHDENNGDAYFGVFNHAVTSPVWQVDENGNTFQDGTKSAVVATEDEGAVSLYTMESPELWFEDFGSATLVDGAATVTVDPLFAQTVNLDVAYHVFLTPLGDCPLYVSEKGPASFTVSAHGGATCAIDFDYRIVAKRAGYEDLRLEAPAPAAEDE